jgi:hypothetical protein
VSTLGLENIALSWEQTRSSTGPSGFRLRYGFDGVTWTDDPSYSYIINAVTWASASHAADSAFFYDLSAVTGLSNQATVYFRLEATSAASGSSGSNRIDNFTVSGTDRVIGVPEASPGLAGLAGALGLMAILRRRWLRLG